MVKTENKEELHAMRHSLAHIMAAAIEELWPEARFGVGPTTETGFYYDVDLGVPKLAEADLEKIEDKMRQIIAADLSFEQYELPINEAVEWAIQGHQTYKRELLEDLKKYGTTSARDISAEALGTEAITEVKEVSFYRLGKFTDLCRGPHVGSSGRVGAFKLDKLAGAYWRGDENKPMLQRIYGLAFATEQQLLKHIEMQELARERDHRKLGQELDLFTFSELVGSGLPLFTPKGTTIRRLLTELMRQVGRKYGAEEVDIPHIAKKQLYEISGHAQKFEDELFEVKSHYGVDFYLKPVNCPHHIQIYASKPRSYRDLPIQYMQTTVQYRDEKPGQIGGLQRVRSITCDDGHIFLARENLNEVIAGLCSLIKEVHTGVGMYGDHWVSLSLRDPDEPQKYIGEEADWLEAERVLTEISDQLKLDAQPNPGEAALYGPKLDFVYRTVTGTETQLATIQLDFATPKRFDLTYIDESGQQQTPIMVHRAILGSLERFMVILLEKTNGHLPFWLNPVQVKVLAVNDQVANYLKQVTEILGAVVLMEPLKYNELRFSVDERNESLGKKIREAEVEKVPVILIVGPKDEQGREVSVRTKKGEHKIKLNKLVDFLTTYED